MSSPSTTLWSNIDTTLIPGCNLKTWLFSTAINPPGLKYLFPTIQATVDAWKSLLSFKWAHLSTKAFPIPLESFQMLSPDLTIPNWLKGQVKHTSELHVRLANKIFSRIQTFYNTPDKDFLNYYRIQHCLSSYPHLKGSILTALWNFYFTTSTTIRDTKASP